MDEPQKTQNTQKENDMSDGNEQTQAVKPVMDLTLIEPQTKKVPGCYTSWTDPEGTQLMVSRGDQTVFFSQEEVEQIAWFIQRRGLFSFHGRMG